MLRRQLVNLLHSHVALSTKPTFVQSAISKRFLSSARSSKQQYQRFGQQQALPFGRGSARYGPGGKRIPPLVYVVAGGGGVYYVYHLEKVPETGRWRFIDVSEATEREMGDQAAQEVLNQYKGRLLPARDPRVVQVNRVVHRILEASGLDAERHSSGGIQELDKWNSKGKMNGVNWKVHVIDDPDQANAFVLPNGSIFVFSGILPICQNEDGLAAVLGHECAHQVARHSGERMSGQKVTTVLQLVLASLGLDIGIAQGALHYFMTLPNSRTNETEADSIGLSLAASACYDPREAVHLWERMAKAQAAKGGAPPSFLSTHPSDSARIDKIKKWLPEVLEKRVDRCGPANDFETAVKRM